MSARHVLEINDAGLLVVDADGLQQQSPGYAVVLGGQVVTGTAAHAQARRYPRETHDRFWRQLDEGALHRPAGDARSNADLAYYQLCALRAGMDGDDVLLATPAEYSREQLSLLLGIAQAAGLSVRGLAPAPLLAAAAVEDPRPRLVLDAQLHRLSLHRVGVDAGRLQLDESRELGNEGLGGLTDAWARMLAAHFVLQARFDPRHDAATEQQLYDSLPEWQAAAESAPTAILTLGAGGRSYRIELEAAAWVRAAEPWYAPLIAAVREEREGIVLLSGRLAGLPGLSAALRGAATVPVVALALDAIGRSALAHADALCADDGAPVFVTSLAARTAAAATGLGSTAAVAAPAAADTAAQSPTHLLWRERAFRLGEAPWRLGGGAPQFARDADDADCLVLERKGQRVLHVPTGRALWLNGRPVYGEVPLAAGDRLRLEEAGEEYLLIAEVTDDGTPTA
jgi:hypothetical protein